MLGRGNVPAPSRVSPNEPWGPYVPPPPALGEGDRGWGPGPRLPHYFLILHQRWAWFSRPSGTAPPLPSTDLTAAQTPPAPARPGTCPMALPAWTHPPRAGATAPWHGGK